MWPALFGVYILILSLTTIAIVGVLGILPFVVLPRGRRERYAINGAVVWARLFVRLITLTRVEVTGQVQLPPNSGALVISNHRSWMDGPVLMAHTRSNGLSKAGIFWIPLIGQFAWISGAVFFDRRSPEQRAKARQDVLFQLRSGNRIQLYPEGTRTKNGELREKVYLTLVRDCFDAKVPVVPCALMGTERVLPPGYFAAIPLQQVRLDIGEALLPEDFDNGDDFADAAWEEVKRRVGVLRC